MDREMMRCLSAVAVSLILIIGLVLGPTVDADAAPVVPAGFEAAVFARVTDPFHLAFDGDGNLFVGRDKSGSGGTSADAVPIHKVSPDGSTVVEFGAAIPDPDGVIVDIHGTVATLGANSVLVASLVSGGKSRITQISPDGSTTSILVEGEQPELTNPQQLAFDSSGKLLWVNCDPPDLDVEKGTVGSFNGSTLSVFGTVDVETCLGGIAIDPDDGRVFVSDFDKW